MATYLVMRRMFCGVCFLLGADGPRQLSLLPVTVLLRMRSAWAGYAQLFLQACRVGEDMPGPSAGGVTVRRGAVTPLVAARVALPTWRPVARLVASLPPSVAPLFADSAAGLLDPSPSPATVAAALRPKRAFGSPLELEAFYRRALAGGFARGIRPEEVVRARVGIFCVAKDADEDRLILDCSAMNALFLLPDSLRLALPTPADLAAIELPPVGASPIFVSKEDLSSFYYSVSLEPWLHVFFVLPRLPAAAMARLGVEDVLWTAGVMGFKPMVGAATLAHRHLKALVEAVCAILPVPRPPLVCVRHPPAPQLGPTSTLQCVSRRARLCRAPLSHAPRHFMMRPVGVRRLRRPLLLRRNRRLCSASVSIRVHVASRRTLSGLSLYWRTLARCSLRPLCRRKSWSTFLESGFGYCCSCALCSRSYPQSTALVASPVMPCVCGPLSGKSSRRWLISLPS